MSTPSDLRALVAIDLGAESCRVSLLRWIESKPVLTLVHRFLNSPRESPQGLRWDLGAIEQELHNGLIQAARSAPEGIRSIAVDGWAVDYVRLDRWGKAIADPYCYRDERTLSSQVELHAKISADRMREITGVGILRINTLYQQCADTSEVKKLRWLNLPEYILYQLGARPVAEFSNATHTQMIDHATGTWSEEIASIADLDLDLFPNLAQMGTIVGNLTGPLTRLPPFADTILIAPAAHDTASAIAGIPAHGDDWAYISSGTWSLVGTVLRQPSNHPEARADNFTNLGAAGGLTLFHKNINSMWLLRQSIDYWETLGQIWTASELVAAAEKLPAPAALLDVNEEELLLPGDMPHRINAQLASRGLPAVDPHHAPTVANLIFHSLAACYAQVLVRLALHSGKKFTRLFIVGGGSQNLYLNHLTAASTGLRVIRGSQESSTIGNFSVQLACLDKQLNQRCLPEDISAWADVLTEL